MSLPTLNTNQPTTEPWFDLRRYLINGWRALGSQTFGMGITANSILVSNRLVADDSTSRIIAEGLPYVGPQNLPMGAFLGGTPIIVELQRSTGRLYIAAAYLSVPREGELTISGVLPRGTTP